MELPFSAPSKTSLHVDDAGFSKSSSSKPISVVGRHCYPFFRDHLHNPYPTSQEKESIVSKANSPDVTMVSVSNWFANSRRRSGWIELCNEYYNGDTKLMVEVCSHVLIYRGKSRSNDPPGLVNKILDMEKKVQGWHEEEIKPSRWVLDLRDLINDFETRLQIITQNESSIVSTSPLLGDESEDQETHSVVGVKRSHKDYILGSYASDTLSRSVSVSSISSLSSLSTECYSSEEEGRPIKRGRMNSTSKKDKKYSADPLSENQYTRTTRTDQLKRPFSTSLEDSAGLERLCKRFRFTYDKLPEVPNPLMIQNEQPLDHPSPNASFQPTIHDTDLDLSLLPIVDLQPPDANWSLDINLYDWSSSPDILSMIDPNCQLNSGEPFPAVMTTITEDKRDDPDQWLQSFFMSDFPESLSPVRLETNSERATSVLIHTSDCSYPTSLTLTPDDTITMLRNSTTETSCDQPELELGLSDVEGEARLGSDILEDNIRWLLSGSGLELDPFPTDFPKETFSLDSPCATSAR
ncbi:hypothetical protein Clacol_003937 [Clathrus columnatus]|uniref:Homeobox domain-containing protein n=1 Tax=Clathrus columnatus TaxID=1419009 RepID=A0AAV5A975_9AGAM|nr:hypothetical protein Clacol_003937 [Clathrus columnatus]